VALHFATDDPALYESDGAVWVVDYVRAAAFLPPSLRSILDLEGSNTFTVDMLSRAASGLDELAGLAGDDFVIFYEPPSLDARISNQFAAFTFMSTAGGRIDHWLAERPTLARRVIIPAGLKWEIRDKLDQANITERVLFPGLEGIARWLTRHYSPRGNPASGA
jgi:hypothetical protein